MSAIALRRAAPLLSPPVEPASSAPELPVIQAPADTPTVTVVVATRPGSGLRTLDRRRLAHALRVADRRLRGVTTPEVRRVLRDRLAELAGTAGRLPLGTGLALVASTEDAALLHLRHPVRNRVLVGEAPSRLDLAEGASVPERLAILVLTLERARLVLAERGVLREVVSDGVPVVRRSPIEDGELLPDYLVQVEGAVAAALPSGTALVVAGDERLVAAYADRRPEGPIVAVLPGDHRATSPLTLLGLARRHLRRTLTGPQRRALAEVAVASEDGRLTVGPEGAARGAARARRPLLVLERGLRARHPRAVAAAVSAVQGAGGRVVIVPEGRLVTCDGIALVRDSDDLGAGVTS